MTDLKHRFSLCGILVECNEPIDTIEACEYLSIGLDLYNSDLDKVIALAQGDYVSLFFELKDPIRIDKYDKICIKRRGI